MISNKLRVLEVPRLRQVESGREVPQLIEGLESWQPEVNGIVSYASMPQLLGKCAPSLRPPLTRDPCLWARSSTVTYCITL